MVIRLYLMSLFGTVLLSQAGEPAFDEYQVKAAFLYNFAKFVEWPPGTFANSSDPIGICIVGQNPFGSTLEDMVKGKKIEALKSADILTVGETEDFTVAGGIIGFRLEGTRVHIQVALDTAEHTKLRISSRLLGLAEIVTKQQ